MARAGHYAYADAQASGLAVTLDLLRHFDAQLDGIRHIHLRTFDRKWQDGFSDVATRLQHRDWASLEHQIDLVKDRIKRLKEMLK